jgi:hypothetical protein
MVVCNNAGRHRLLWTRSLSCTSGSTAAKQFSRSVITSRRQSPSRGGDDADRAFPRQYGIECRLPTGSQDDWSLPRPTIGSWTSTQSIQVASGSSKLLSVDAQYAQQHAGTDCRLRLTLSDGSVALSRPLATERHRAATNRHGSNMQQRWLVSLASVLVLAGCAKFTAVGASIGG